MKLKDKSPSFGSRFVVELRLFPKPEAKSGMKVEFNADFRSIQNTRYFQII
jgi:hypothetical protein